MHPANQNDEESRIDRSRFSMFGTSSNSRSFEIESWSYIKHKDYNLQIMQKVKTESTRTMIPATFYERLAFYRSYTSAMYKTHINCMQDIDIRLFVWYYVINVILKALPSIYTQMFLSNYTTDEHMYMSKMVPFTYGTNYVIILSAFSEIHMAMNDFLKYVYIISTGIYKKMPWFACDVQTLYGYLCIPTSDYRAFLENATKTYNYSLSLMGDASIAVIDDQHNIIHKIFISPVAHYIALSVKLDTFAKKFNNEFLLVSMIIFVVTCCFYGQIFKRPMWVILNKLQWILTFVFIIALTHIMWTYLNKSLSGPLPMKNTEGLHLVYKKLKLADVDYLAESMIAPPLIHVLRGRSRQPVNPSLDGGAVVLSNALYYLLRGFMTKGLRYFCESHFGTFINFKLHGTKAWFYLWPVYFSTYPMGGILTLLFFIIHFTVDLLTFIIFFHCTLDILACEWPKIKKWMYMIAIILLTYLYSYFLLTPIHTIPKIIFLNTKSLITCLDCVVVFWMYPVGRLIDDITFHYGRTPSRIRIWSLKLTPLYYIIKTYIVHNAYYDLFMSGIKKKKLVVAYWLYVCSWLISLVLLVVGLFYAIINYIFLKKEHWQCLFRPRPLWGPPDHIPRQLRKQFDSRVYIKSQASRYLSRHQLSKEEDHFYKLDLCYERPGRRSTVIHDTFKFDVEKKTV